VGPILEGIRKFKEFRILCTPDHPTPLARMTHTSDPVPFIIYGGESVENSSIVGYDEDSARESGLVVEEGFRLMELMVS